MHRTRFCPRFWLVAAFLAAFVWSCNGAPDSVPETPESVPDTPETAAPAAPTDAASTDAAPTDAASTDAASAPEVAVKNARTPLPGVLTAGQPTAEELDAVAAAGYRTVVNLRPPTEDGAWDEGPKVSELGMRYVSIPVRGAEGLTEENARSLAAVLDDPASHPVFVHCGTGNRVGALLALKAFYVDGTDPEAALQLGRDAGLTKLEPAVVERIGGGEGEGEAPSQQ